MEAAAVGASRRPIAREGTSFAAQDEVLAKERPVEGIDEKRGTTRRLLSRPVVDMKNVSIVI